MNINMRNALIGLAVLAIIGLIVYFSMRKSTKEGWFFDQDTESIKNWLNSQPGRDFMVGYLKNGIGDSGIINIINNALVQGTDYSMWVGSHKNMDVAGYLSPGLVFQPTTRSGKYNLSLIHPPEVKF